MKKVFKIAFASLLAFSIAPALAAIFNQSKEVTSVQAEETVVTADQVKYQDGDTVKTFEELPTGYTFENGVLTVTSSSTNDYSIWVEDTSAGNLTIVFERDYGGNSLGTHGESSIYFEYQGKKKLTLTSIDSVDVTLGALYGGLYTELHLTGKLNLKIVGNTIKKFEDYDNLVYAPIFNVLDDASVYAIDPYWVNASLDSCSIINIRLTVNINTTGYVKVGFNLDPYSTENHSAYAIKFEMTKKYFNLIRCDGEMMFYAKPRVYEDEDASKLRDYKSLFDLDFDEYIFYQINGPTIKPGGVCHLTKIKPYIVSYDPNGGTGEMDFYGGRICTIQLPTCTFTPPAGKRFKCWKLQGYSIECQPGDDFEIMHNRDATFDAIWEDVPADALTGTVSITGSLKYDETLTASVTDTNNTGTLSYQWRRNGEPISGATNSTYLVTENDIGYTLSVVVTSSVETGSIVGTASGVIAKADGPIAPTGISAVACTTEANNDGVLKGVTTEMEYKLSTSSEWANGTGADITGLVSGTYNVRVKETSTHEAGEIANVVVNAYNAPTQYAVTVNKGTANPITALAGTTITIIAAAPEEGYVFDKWVSTDGVVFADANSETTTFTMPEGDVTVTATYKPVVVPPTPAPSSSGLSGGAIAGIVIASILVAGIGGFALVWFVIKKKTWADFVAIFKKK